MTCRTCGAPDPAENVELDRALYAAGVRFGEHASWAYCVGYEAGTEDAERRAEEARQDLLADAQRNGWCKHVHPAVAESVARMLGDWDGEAMSHARSVARHRAEYLPESAASPQCDCGDWAAGFAYRDAMARYGGVAEAVRLGVFDFLPRPHYCATRPLFAEEVTETDRAA